MKRILIPFIYMKYFVILSMLTMFWSVKHTPFYLFSPICVCVSLFFAFGIASTPLGFWSNMIAVGFNCCLWVIRDFVLSDQLVQTQLDHYVEMKQKQLEK